MDSFKHFFFFFPEDSHVRWKILKCGKIIHEQKSKFYIEDCRVTLKIDSFTCRSCFHPTFLLLLPSRHGELYADRHSLALIRPYETLQPSFWDLLINKQLNRAAEELSVYECVHQRLQWAPVCFYPVSISRP